MSYTQKYGFILPEEKIVSGLENIAAGIPSMQSPEILKNCFSMMDLTTLRTNDTESDVKALVQKANGVVKEFPGYPLPASICVYSNLAHVVRDTRESSELHVTTVASCFPSAQSFLPVNELECRMAVQNGADEIDIVLALNSFLAGDYEKAYNEIAAMKAAIDEEALKAGRKVELKVILETGLLSTPERIAEASFLAMEAGADFIKTSTGKVDVNATPMAAYVMCSCIKCFYEKTGRKVGFKAAGGISTAKDALSYYCIVSSILGKEWLNKNLFRVGVSRLGNSLVSAIEQKTVNYF